MPTILDVARRAGVSRSTVSLVLNKSPLVKDSTRKLVLQAIEELNYVPNVNARGLSARVTGNLGVLCMQDYLPGDPRISYDNDHPVGLCSFNISNGIMDGLTGTDYGVVTERFCSIAQPDALPRMVREKRVDGLFVVGMPYSPVFLDNLRAAGMPFVLVGVGSYEEGADCVYAEPGEGTGMALQELILTGHRRIALINAPTGLRSHAVRLEAFRKALSEHALPFREDWNLAPERNSGACAAEVFSAFWQAGNRPDGIVTANGQMALGVMAFLHEQGVRIPDDLSVIAYEDSSLCGYGVPALTAVNIRKEEMGYRAAKCLMRRLREPDAPIYCEALTPFLVKRDSVKDRTVKGEA